MFLILLIPLAVKGNQSVLVLPLMSGNSTADAVSKDSAEEVRRILYSSGRFFPEESSRIAKLFPGGAIGETQMRQAFRSSGIARFWTVNVSQDASMIHVRLDIYEADSDFVRKKSLTVSSSIVQNLSLLLAREVVFTVDHEPIRVQTEKVAAGLFSLDAGQWQGLAEGKSYSTGSGTITILRTDRFTSLCSSDNELPASLIIDQMPDTDYLKKDLDDGIIRNIMRTYGIENTKLGSTIRSDTKLIQGTVFINAGASLILPGYGSYLSTYYMGFENPKPSYAGMAAGVSAELIQLLAVPLMTDFKSTPFPWIRDRSMTGGQRSLEMFLWCTIPLTWSATYFDQLAVQYDQSRILPPMFDHQAAAAAVSSLVIPGGGLFYKGYRAAGWGYFSAEMMAASVFCYYGKSKKGWSALAFLAGLKTVEILNAAFIRPDYLFYNREYEREGNARVDFSLRADDRGVIPSLAVVLPF